MGPIWGRQDPGGPHALPMNFAIWDGDPHIIHMKQIYIKIYLYIFSKFP